MSSNVEISACVDAWLQGGMCSNNAGSVTLNFSKKKKGQDRLCVKINRPGHIDSTCFLGDPVTREQLWVLCFTWHVPSAFGSCLHALNATVANYAMYRKIVHIYKANVYFNETGQAARFEWTFGYFSGPQETKSETGQRRRIRKNSSYTLASVHLLK